MITRDSKILKPDEFVSLRQECRQQGLRVVHCHGVFDLLHPGHIIHLQEARSLGDILVVSITSSSYVQKGPGRPYFTDDLRLRSIASLSCVDYVILSEAVSALQILDYIQPDIYVKGAEYADIDNDISQNSKLEFERVYSYGGEIHFTGGQVFSSTRLLNNQFPILSLEAREFLRDFSSRNSFTSIRQYMEKMQDMKILVLGDIIIDQYVFCSVQGLSSKDRALSARFQQEETYPGGILAVARHLASFSRQVCLYSIVGDTFKQYPGLNKLGHEFQLDLQYEPAFQTAIKRKYVERRGIRNDYDKLFAINYIDAADESAPVVRSAFYERLNRIIEEFDLVVLGDFGHGTVDESLMQIIQDKSKYLSLNCQTNSVNFGNNLISKYRRADCFTLDEREMKLASSTYAADMKGSLQQLTRQLNADKAWLTLGSRGAVGFEQDQPLVAIPALTLEVEDTIGAGDAFFALASLCARAEVPLEMSSFLANVAGALAVNILGNSQPIEKNKLLKYASTLLNH